MMKFQAGQLSVLKQRPRNNQTVIGGNDHYDTVIVLEAQYSKIPTNNQKENDDKNDFFYFTGKVLATGNRNSV